MHRRVLVIDDAPEVHELISRSLAGEGVEVRAAFDGLSGLHMAVHLEPDLVLLDVVLGDMDGWEVCELLGVQEQTCRTPVMFLSSSNDPDDRVRALDQGALDYISKPFEPRELRARVRMALRHGYLLRLENTYAMVDGMTGLWNRRYFAQRLSAELASAARHARRLSCVMADIDRFKQINDTYGHVFGDQVIRRVGEALQRGCRTEDVVCRYGGEEFAILCPDVSAEGAMILAERLRLAVTQVELSDATVHVTCSFGVSDALVGADTLISRADAALYRAKAGGRNCVERDGAARAA